MTFSQFSCSLSSMLKLLKKAKKIGEWAETVPSLQKICRSVWVAEVAKLLKYRTPSL